MSQPYFFKSAIMSLMCSRKSRHCSFDRIDGLVVTPLGKPRCKHCSSSSRLAVSTNSFMLFSLSAMGQNPIRCFGQTMYTMIGPASRRAAVRRLHEKGAAAGRLPSRQVAPAIADDKAATQIEPPAMRRLPQHARLRLAASAVVAVVMVAGQHFEHRQFRL